MHNQLSSVFTPGQQRWTRLGFKVKLVLCLLFIYAVLYSILILSFLVPPNKNLIFPLPLPGQLPVVLIGPTVSTPYVRAGFTGFGAFLLSFCHKSPLTRLFYNSVCLKPSCPSLSHTVTLLMLSLGSRQKLSLWFLFISERNSELLHWV